MQIGAISHHLPAFLFTIFIFYKLKLEDRRE